MTRKTKRQEIKDFWTGMFGLLVLLPGAVVFGIGMGHSVWWLVLLGAVILVGSMLGLKRLVERSG